MAAARVALQNNERYIEIDEGENRCTPAAKAGALAIIAGIME